MCFYSVTSAVHQFHIVNAVSSSFFSHFNGFLRRDTAAHCLSSLFVDTVNCCSRKGLLLHSVALIKPRVCDPAVVECVICGLSVFIKKKKTLQKSDGVMLSYLKKRFFLMLTTAKVVECVPS